MKNSGGPLDNQTWQATKTKLARIFCGEPFICQKFDCSVLATAHDCERPYFDSFLKTLNFTHQVVFSAADELAQTADQMDMRSTATIEGDGWNTRL